MQVFFFTKVGDTPLKAYLIMATVSCKLSIYKDLLSSLTQFLTFRFLSTLFSVLPFLRCQSMNYLIMEFKKVLGLGRERRGKAETRQSKLCIIYYKPGQIY